MAATGTGMCWGLLWVGTGKMRGRVCLDAGPSLKWASFLAERGGYTPSNSPGEAAAADCGASAQQIVRIPPSPKSNLERSLQANPSNIQSLAVHWPFLREIKHL